MDGISLGGVCWSLLFSAACAMGGCVVVVGSAVNVALGRSVGMTDGARLGTSEGASLGVLLARRESSGVAWTTGDAEGATMPRASVGTLVLVVAADDASLDCSTPPPFVLLSPSSFPHVTGHGNCPVAGLGIEN